MKLDELLCRVEMLTNIELYEGSTELWVASKEKLIKKDITVGSYYNDCREELYDKYNDYEVIGISVTSDNKMQITIYKEG